MQFLDRAFYKLDSDVRRSSRLYMKDVEGVLKEIEQMGTVTSNHALLLIRCCGLLLADEALDTRIALTDKVWNAVTNKKCPLDVSHYNALLKVYLENEHKFLSTDFLASMEQKGIAPNRVTYQRLVTKYCQDGDINGASKILEFMKEKQLPVNEIIFNSLVMGHAKTGDLTGAREILEVMRNSKLDPSAQTYSALGCGYAQLGDIEGLQKVLKEAEQNDVFLLDKDYLDIIVALAVNGHSQYITEFIPKLPKLMGFNQQCMAAIFELINKKQDEAAFALLKTMVRSRMADGEFSVSGQFFIRQLVKTDVPFEKILHYCQEMKNLDLNDRGLAKAVEVSLVHQKTDLAILLLKEMHKEGEPIRCHYFWPIFVALRNSSEKETYDLLKVMTDMSCPISYESYSDYILPNLNKTEPDVIVQNMKELGETVGKVVNPFLHHFLMNKSPSEAVNLINKYPVRLSSALLMRVLASACTATGDSVSVLKILTHMKENPEFINSSTIRDYGGQLIDDCIYEKIDKTNLEDLLHRMKEMDFHISRSSFENIEQKLAGYPNCQNILQSLESLISSDIESTPDGVIPHPREMSTEDLESHLLELRSKKMSVRGVLRRLFLVHCRSRNYSRSLEIKAEMEMLGMEFSAGMYSQLMDLCVSTDNLEEALKYKKLIDLREDFVTDSFKILNLAGLLITNDRYDDAKNLILNLKYDAAKFAGKPNDGLDRNVARVLVAASEKGDVDQVKELFELMVVRLQFAAPSNRVLGPIVKASLMKGDISTAMADFEHYFNLYKMTPFKDELYKKLIETDDSENLQKVLDICTSVHGEINALHDLAGCFIECGLVKQAKKIFETPGLRAKEDRLDVLCDHFLMTRKPEGIANLIEATRRLFDVNMEKLYFHLLQAYVKENDVQKASGIWTTMQEEDIMPSNKLLIVLANFLKRNDQPVPFNVPNEEETFFSEPAFYRPRQFGRIREASEGNKKPEENKKEMGIAATSQLIQNYVKNNCLLEAVKLTEELLAKGLFPMWRTFRFLVNKMGRDGEVDYFLRLQPFLTSEMKFQISFGRQLANAYLNSNRHIELLEEWEKNPEAYVAAFPIGGYLRFLQSHPELKDRLLHLANVYAKEHNSLKPLNMVFNYWTIAEEFDKAREVFKRLQDSPDEKLLYRASTTHAVQNQNENVSSALCSLAKEANLSGQQKGDLIGCHIDVLLSLNKSGRALATLQDAMNECRLTEQNFHHKTLQRLHAALQEQGKPVPFVIPPPQPRGRRDITSSSDDEL